MTLKTETRYAIGPATAKSLDTDGLRSHFHKDGLFAEGEINLVHTHCDRFILGSAVPWAGTLTLDHVSETGTPSFLGRREMGILNIGKTGQVTVGDATYTLENGELLNIGIGAGPVAFSGGRFYLTSCPAHRNCPTKMIKLSDARRVEPGARETANQRVIIQFLHPEVCETCQLPMGYTQFQPRSLWNTMPAHLHDRRMEAYLYFDLPDDARVFHFMGTPEETHHLVMANEQAVISPPWSIHCGAGTAAYTFCWGMAGDNMDFGGMDMVAMDDLR